MTMESQVCGYRYCNVLTPHWIYKIQRHVLTSSESLLLCMLTVWINMVLGSRPHACTSAIVMSGDWVVWHSGFISKCHSTFLVHVVLILTNWLLSVILRTDDCLTL